MLIASPTLKQPAERILQRFEFGQPGGAAITSIIETGVTPRGRVAEVTALTIGSAIVGSTYAQLALVGGTAGELYNVRCLVADAGGNRFEQDAEILVLDLAFRDAGTATPGYLSLQAFVQRAGVDETVRLTDEAGTGVIDAARLDAALQDAQALIDSYLGARYQVPLALPAPAPIPTLTFDLAVARLYRGELPDGVEAKRDEAVRLLKDLAAGKAAIPVAPAPTTTSPAPVLVEPHDRLFSRKRMGGF
ncbi:MAG: gp436 family protein [Sandaracinobacter sp.]